MGLSAARKLLVFLMVTVFLFSGSADAWSWSWGSGQSGSNGDWGWSSGGSFGSGSGGSDSNSGGSSWGWGWSSDGTDTNWVGEAALAQTIQAALALHTTVTALARTIQAALVLHTTVTALARTTQAALALHITITALAQTTQAYSGSNHSSIIGSTHNHTAPSLGRKIAVTVWKNGYGYTEWTAKHAPFYVNDVLVFTYNNNDQTQSKTKHHHDKKKNDVYLLPDMKSFKRCNVARGKKLVARGGSSSRGFKLLLRKVHTYYFVSGDHNDCNHNMKFSVHPIPHPSSH
ncbi:hypothetical protein AXX17_AT4G39240 [Arabidopsis thaliana]|uniref:Phytocyanin domain-containing protein n=2 Tax=Arabidopsis thaliana TaxID=3702 RepID=A0A178UZ05_ARATH|nr:hypothetical protein AXX17_AT4G39240 [Arabidopsis thaliana]